MGGANGFEVGPPEEADPSHQQAGGISRAEHPAALTPRCVRGARRRVRETLVAVPSRGDLAITLLFTCGLLACVQGVPASRDPQPELSAEIAADRSQDLARFERGRVSPRPRVPVGPRSRCEGARPAEALGASPLGLLACIY